MSGDANAAPAAENRRAGFFAGRGRRAIAGAGTRYSRFVGLMKFILPVAAAALVVLIVTWPETDDRDAGFRVGYTAGGLGDAGAPGMVNARYVGTDGHNRPFVVTAESATAEPDNPDRIRLVALQADITLDDARWMTVIADSGVYDRIAQTLRLGEAVSLYSDDGFELHAGSALVDLEAGSAASDAPVQAQGPLGVLKANGFRIAAAGRRLHFIGAVRATIDPGAR